jgi:putative ABC transport system permease protein
MVTAINPSISHDYFRAMGIPLVKGRAFTEEETKSTPKTVIISETFASTYFPGEDPLGKRLIIDAGEKLTCEIIGVAGNVRQFSLRGPYAATMYMPSLEMGRVNLVVRTTVDPLALASAVREAVRATDKDQPVVNVLSMEQVLRNSVAGSRFQALLLSLFAAAGLLLAAVGIYGVMSYDVAQRAHEIGVRMALGASAVLIFKLIIGHGLKLSLAGVAFGLAAAYGLAQLITAMLFEISATDPLTFAGIPLLLTVIALLACWIPARRATKVDPMAAIRRL